MGKDYRDFQDFYNHPFIQSIAPSKRWSVSDQNKRPIDIVEYKNSGRIWGATTTDELSLVDLPTLCSVIPDAKNNAYYMDSLIDHFVILDIEPNCPDHLKNEFLKLNYIYGERSMSGKGYHLVFPMPKNFHEYPAAMQKTAMQEDHKWYEILLNHWVTFTRNMIPPATGKDGIESIFEDLAKEQISTSRSDVDVMDLKPNPMPPKHDTIITLLSEQKYRKTVDDFYGDYSKYEYGHMGFLYYRIKLLLNTHTVKSTKHKYTSHEIAWLLYVVAKDAIPHRVKHDEKRDGLPWLLYLARELIAKDETL